MVWCATSELIMPRATACRASCPVLCTVLCVCCRCRVLIGSTGAICGGGGTNMETERWQSTEHDAWRQATRMILNSLALLKPMYTSIGIYIYRHKTGSGMTSTFVSIQRSHLRFQNKGLETIALVFGQPSLFLVFDY